MPKTIDFHSHILPGMDHGCSDLAQSLAQIEMIRRGGTDTVVATSHFYPGRMNLSGFVQRRENAVRALCGQLPENAPQIAVGAEVACYPGLENMKELEKLCIAGTRCLLLEMPLSRWTDAHFETVDAISSDGFTVVMAHIDRYPKEDVAQLMQLDVAAQVNASSVCSFLRRGKTKGWFAAGRVFAIGSDLHGSEKGGYDHFPRALAKLGTEKVQQVMTQSEALLRGAVYLNEMKIQN